MNYRFSQPDQAMPLALPQSYSTGRVVRIPSEPQAIGDHLRRKRLARKMLQREVAEQVGVTESYIFNWEANATKPEIRFMPAIIRFLGYDPQPEANRWGERLVRGRTTLGLSQKDAARKLDVDPGTLARWERGEREPAGVFAARANDFLVSAEVARSPANSARTA